MNLIKRKNYIKVDDIILDAIISSNYTSQTATVLCYLLNEMSCRYHNNANNDGYLFKEDRTITITEHEAGVMLRKNICEDVNKKIPGDNMTVLVDDVFKEGDRDISVVDDDYITQIANTLLNNLFAYIVKHKNGDDELIYIFSSIKRNKHKKEIAVTFNADFIEMYLGVLDYTGRDYEKFKKLYVDVMVSLNRRRAQSLYGYIIKYQMQLDKYGETNWIDFRILRDLLNADNARANDLKIYAENALDDINKCLSSRPIDNHYIQYAIDYKKQSAKKNAPYKYFKIYQTAYKQNKDNKPKSVETKKTAKPKKTDNNKHDAEIKEIIDYLNDKAGTKYTYKAKITVKNINARLKEGFTVDDFKKVIDNKVLDWKGSEMEQYIRPETLFGNKFEGYLNGKVKGKKQPSYQLNTGYVPNTEFRRVGNGTNIDWDNIEVQDPDYNKIF